MNLRFTLDIKIDIIDLSFESQDLNFSAKGALNFWIDRRSMQWHQKCNNIIGLEIRSLTCFLAFG